MYKLLGLDDAGRRALNRSTFACVVSNIALFLSFGITFQIITALLRPLMSGGELSTIKIYRNSPPT
jgi:hypothetical protein